MNTRYLNRKVELAMQATGNMTNWEYMLIKRERHMFKKFYDNHVYAYKLGGPTDDAMLNLPKNMNVKKDNE